MFYGNISFKVKEGGKVKVLLKSKKRIVFAIIALFIILAVIINLGASMFFSFTLFKRDGWNEFEEYSYGEQLKNESEWIEKRSEKIQIKNAEGKSITALEIKNEHISHSYMVICHQYGGSPQSMEEYAKHFYELGFNIILPYLRGHGDSSYKNISFGWKDGADIVDWVDAIIDEDEKARIALFGVSMGANAVTLAASEDLPENVRFVIADGCYTSMDALMKEYIKNQTSFSSIVTKTLLSLFAENKLGVSFKNADTISALGDIELPIMFINGENDDVVPPLLSKKLYENCDSEGVEEVIIEGGTHGENLSADELTYWSNIDAFVLNMLGI